FGGDVDTEGEGVAGECEREVSAERVVGEVHDCDLGASSVLDTDPVLRPDPASGVENGVRSVDVVGESGVRVVQVAEGWWDGRRGWCAVAAEDVLDEGVTVDPDVERGADGVVAG